MILTKGNDAIEIHQRLAQLDEMHPISFRLAFGLTHEVAAEELGVEPQTMRSYLRKIPSRRVRKLAATLTKTWLAAGRPLVNAQHLVSYPAIVLDVTDRPSRSR